MTGIDWDDAYANMAHVPGSEALPARWAAAAEAFRAGWGRREEGVPYGAGERQALDLFHPEGAAAGLLVFVHGGYWMKFDRSLWSQFAAGALGRGWAVAMPSYTLAPDARLGEMVREIGQAVAVAAARVAGPVRLAGHSAGGHLVARMACANAPLAPEVAERLAKVVSISGLHDLRPLMRTAMNATLRIDDAEAAAESPALLAPREGLAVTAWVGGDERPEFVRQARLLGEAWPAAKVVVEPGHNHFSVIDALGDPASPLVTEILGDAR